MRQGLITELVSHKYDDDCVIYRDTMSTDNPYKWAIIVDGNVISYDDLDERNDDYYAIEQLLPLTGNFIFTGERL